MINWLRKNQSSEPRLSSRPVIRALTTQRGTRFDVFAETDHYIMCHEPVGSTDTPSDALLDFEDMAGQGYWLCHIYHGPGASVVFEKRFLISDLMGEVSALRSIGKELLEDQAAWITNGEHSGPLDPEQWELYARARKIIEPSA